jgi:hypothetical protein
MALAAMLTALTRELQELLLLLAALANWLHYMLGLATEMAGMHLRFKANSIKHRQMYCPTIWVCGYAKWRNWG